MISRASRECRSTSSPIQKNVALAECRSNRSNTCGVTAGSGPSSIVIATEPFAAAWGGKCVQFGPNNLLRGQRPAAVRIMWSTKMTANTHGHR